MILRLMASGERTVGSATLSWLLRWSLGEGIAREVESVVLMICWVGSFEGWPCLNLPA